jgi:single-stranded-DNA-specific exonuclease
LIQADRNWIEPRNIEPSNEIFQAFKNEPLIAQALSSRGIISLDQADSFLNPGKYQPASPYEFPDLVKALERIRKASQTGETIGIWGDFDVDGQTATTLLVTCMKMIGAKVEYHIPIRAEESHGIYPPILKVFLEKGINLLISCDTGISANDAVELSSQQGVDVIITDHHSLPDQLPFAFAIINPNQLSTEHPFRFLSGVGTAYQLAKAVLEDFGYSNEVEPLLDLVALGTVADMAHLNSENRYLVQTGLIQLRKNQRVGLQELLHLADVDPELLSEEHISFIIAPRLNAIGRMDNANPMIDFLTSTDKQITKKMALELENWNFKRKLAVDQVYQAAIRQIENDPSFLSSPLLLLSQINWPAGVVGIVASRLVNQFSKPVIILSIDDKGIAHGSARSVEGMDINYLISTQKDLLISWGGHPMAAGLSMKADLINQFKTYIENTILKIFPSTQKQQDLRIDAFLTLKSIKLELAESIEKLSPFGPGNPPVILSSRNLELVSSSIIGKNQEHLKVKVRDQTGIMKEVIWWQGNGSPQPQGIFDLAFTVRASNFKGRRDIQMEWTTFRDSISESIIAHPQVPYKIKDLRKEDHDTVLKILNSIKCQMQNIWGENINIPGITFVDRLQVTSGSLMAVATIPPRREILKQVIELVKPGEIFLFGLNPQADDQQEFIKKISGLLRFAITHKDGVLDLELLAARTSQTSIAVKTAINLIEAKGSITILSSKFPLIKIGRGGQSNQEKENKIENDLHLILKENIAYRKFYLNADPGTLLLF